MRWEHSSNSALVHEQRRISQLHADYTISRRAQRVFFGSSECNLSNECVQYVGENPTNCRLLDAAGLVVVDLERDFEEDHH